MTLSWQLVLGSHVLTVTSANPPAISPPSPVQPLEATIMAQAEAATNVASLVCSSILYWFPDYWWQQGLVAELSKWTPEFSHDEAYSRAKAVFADTADSLLDMSFYGTRWVLLSLDTSSVARPPATRGRRQAAGLGDRP